MMVKRDHIYHISEVKLAMNDFSMDTQFKNGLPLIVLDLINSLTGFDIINDINKMLNADHYIQRMNPDDPKFI